MKQYLAEGCPLLPLSPDKQNIQLAVNDLDELVPHSWQQPEEKVLLLSLSTKYSTESCERYFYHNIVLLDCTNSFL